MQKVYKWFLIFLGSCSLLFANEIPRDNNVCIGKLDNGLTYYLQKNTNPKNWAHAELIVNAGYLQEDPDQTGIAHLIEHMCFRTTKHFSEDYSMVTFLETIGSKHGIDHNAYTSLDETVYTFDIPLTKKNSLEKTVLMLSDIAQRVEFNSLLVEREKNIVIDELFLRDAMFSSFSGLLQFSLKDSSYHKIFKEDQKACVKKVPLERICDFYHKWYRPDNMAIVIVGDIDIDMVKESIELYFGDLQNPESSTEVKKTYTRNTHKIQFSLCNGISPRCILQGLTRPWCISTYDDLKNQIIFDVAMDLLQQRLNILPLVSAVHSARVDAAPLVRGVDQILLQIYGKRSSQQKGFYQVIHLIEDMKKNHIPSVEFSYVLSQYKQQFVDLLQQKLSHEELASFCKCHFLSDNPLLDQKVLVEASLDLLEEITKEDIIKMMQNVFNWDLFHGAITSSQLSQLQSQKNIASLYTIFPEEEKQTAKQVVKRVVDHLKYQLNAPNIESCIDHPTEIISCEKSPENEYETLILDNGLKVILHPRDEESGNVYIKFLAKGGRSLFSEDEYASLSMLPIYMHASGLANLSCDHFDVFRDKHQIGMRFSLFSRFRVLSTKTRTHHLKELFQTIHALFHNRYFDSYSGLMCSMDNFSDPSVSDFAEKYIQSINPMNQGLHANNKPRGSEIQMLLQKIWQNPKDFTVVMLGDFSLDKAKEYVKTYFSFPKQEKEMFSIETLPTSVLSEDCYIKQYTSKKEENPQHSLFLGISQANIENVYVPKAFVELINQRLYQKVRRELGISYSICVDVLYPLYPSLSEMFITIKCSCTQNPQGNLKDSMIVMQTIQDFSLHGPTQQEIDNIKVFFLERKNLYQNTNSIWMERHFSREYQFPKNIFTAEVEDIQDNITQKSLQDFAEMVCKKSCRVYHSLLRKK